MLIHVCKSMTLMGWIFLSLFLVFAFLFGWTAYARNLRENFTFRALATSPPSTFWGEFETVTKMAEEAYQYALEEIQDRPFDCTKEEFKGVIDEGKDYVRVVLSGLINLVMRLDEANTEKRLVYRANIMQVDEFPFGTTRVKKIMSASNNDVSIKRFLIEPSEEHFSGIISILNGEYSTTNKVKLNEEDADIKPLLLPFTKSTETDAKFFHSNLRGAPFAIATRTPDYVKDVRDIVEHYKNNAEPRSKGVLSELIRYYNVENKSRAHSILSIPLFIGKSYNGWVLNIYRNQTGMLYTTDKTDQFPKMVCGITNRLKEILLIIATAQDEYLSLEEDSGNLEVENE